MPSSFSLAGFKCQGMPLRLALKGQGFEKRSEPFRLSGLFLLLSNRTRRYCAYSSRHVKATRGSRHVATSPRTKYEHRSRVGERHNQAPSWLPIVFEFSGFRKQSVCCGLLVSPQR